MAPCGTPAINWNNNGFSPFEEKITCMQTCFKTC